MLSGKYVINVFTDINQSDTALTGLLITTETGV